MVSIGGGGGSKSTSNTKVRDLTPPEFTGLRPEIADAISYLLLSGGPTFGAPSTGMAGAPAGSPWAGGQPGSTFVAPITPAEQATLAQLGAAGGPQPTDTASQDLLLRTIHGDFLDPANNPFLMAAIEAQQRKLGENFTQIELPGLQSRFTAAGQSIQPQGSSAFDTAAAIALRGLVNAQGDIATNVLAQNYQAERGRQQEAVTTASQINDQEAQRLISTLQAQALPRLIEQHGIDAGLEEFRRRVDLILKALGIGGQLAQPTPSSTQTASSKTSPEWSFGIG